MFPDYSLGYSIVTSVQGEVIRNGIPSMLVLLLSILPEKLLCIMEGRCGVCLDADSEMLFIQDLQVF